MRWTLNGSRLLATVMRIRAVIALGVPDETNNEVFGPIMKRFATELNWGVIGGIVGVLVYGLWVNIAKIWC